MLVVYTFYQLDIYILFSGILIYSYQLNNHIELSIVPISNFEYGHHWNNLENQSW